MISKALAAAALCLWAFPQVARAELTCSALVSNYHRLHVREKPTGVYEWSAEGLLFVHAHVPYTGSETPEEMESVELQTVNRMLFEWVVGQVGGETSDAPLPPGLDFVRRIVRGAWPTWGRSAAWRFSGETCAFTEELKTERLYTLVCRKADVVASVPDAFRQPVSRDVWLRGLEELVADVYAAHGDLAFMWRIGALDALDVSRRTSAVFPSFQTDGFKEAHADFLDKACETWRDVESPAKVEYAALRSRLSDYLLSSKTASGFARDARAAQTPPPITTWRSLPGDVCVTTNRIVTVVTNAVAPSAVRTNESVVAVSESGTVSVMVDGDRVARHSESTVTHEVVETETVTTVRTIRHGEERTVSRDIGEPTFERLYLAGGSLPNQARTRTSRGAEAEHAFFAQMPMDERRSVLLEALRENPGDKGLWNLYGRLLKAEGDALGAIVCYRNALRIDRSYVFALTNLAEAYHELGYSASARACAALARGLADDAWCVKHAEDVLSAPAK